MKSYTLEDVSNFAALFQAGLECGKCVEWKSSIQKFLEILPLKAAQAHVALENGTYKPESLTQFDIVERGKPRHIQAVKPLDRMVQKSLTNNVLKPVIEPLLIDDNGASRNNMGTDYALKRLRKHLTDHYKQYGNSGGILVMDLHNFFGSIRHDILLNMYKEIIDDERIIYLLELFINQFSREIGLGLGSEISQISAIFYPNKIDHYIKDELGVDGYGRYMDDSYIISDDIDFLKKCRDIVCKMYADIGIEMNLRKTKIVRFDKNSFVYLQKRISFNQNGRIIMKPVKKVFVNRKNKLKNQYRKYKDGKIELSSIQNAYNSWRGNLLRYNCYKQIQSVDHYFMKLFGVAYDGETIDDIRFMKILTLYNSKYNDNEDVDLVKLGKIFAQWDNNAKYDCSKRIIYKKLRHKYYQLLFRIKLLK